MSCLLDTIPGVGGEVAEVIVSEIGIDMSCFPSADALASWAGAAQHLAIMKVLASVVLAKLPKVTKLCP
jgi:hypothetical protein